MQRCNKNATKKFQQKRLKPKWNAKKVPGWQSKLDIHALYTYIHTYICVCVCVCMHSNLYI